MTKWSSLKRFSSGGTCAIEAVSRIRHKNAAWIAVVFATLFCLLALAGFARKWLDGREISEWTNPITEVGVSLPSGWRGGREINQGNETTFIFRNPGAGLVVNISHEEIKKAMGNDEFERFWRAYPAAWAARFEPRIRFHASSFPSKEEAMWIGCGRTETGEVLVRIFPRGSGIWRFVVLASGNARPDDATAFLEPAAMSAAHLWLDPVLPKVDGVPRPAARCTDVTTVHVL